MDGILMDLDWWREDEDKFSNLCTLAQLTFSSHLLFYQEEFGIKRSFSFLVFFLGGGKGWGGLLAYGG